MIICERAAPALGNVKWAPSWIVIRLLVEAHAWNGGMSRINVIRPMHFFKIGLFSDLFRDMIQFCKGPINSQVGERPVDFS
jgi:hypothetical protein